VAAVVSIEAVAIVLLVVLVSGLLRSHADILRALHRLGIDLEAGNESGTTAVRLGRGPGHAAGAAAAGTSPNAGSRSATDLTGVSPSGEAIRIAVTSVRHDSLLAFLTTGCTTCAVFWQALAAPDLRVPGGARAVIVAHSPEEESLSRVRSLAPREVPVLMASAAWEEYDVAYAPYFVYVSGSSGRVVGEGVAGTWDELTSLLGQAMADGATASAMGSGSRAPSTRQQLDRDRAQRIDDDLSRAGIAPGDPRLYPTHLDTAPSPLSDAQDPT
jgi:hypothetical protein